MKFFCNPSPFQYQNVIGLDYNGCEMPGMCLPSKGGPIGKDGTECPIFCPTVCGPEEVQCWGGEDPNGCPMSDTCVPMKGPMGKDGVECPPMCPMYCPDEMQLCPGVMDDFGCMGPEFCMPMDSTCEPAM